MVMSCNSISKAFPGVQALDAVDFELRRGEVHAICGENGAGKSTLIKIVTGLYKKDQGEIIYEGKPVDFKSVQECRKNGISLIPQELHLAPRLTVAENIFMTGHPRKGLFVDWKAMWKKTHELQERLGSTALSFRPNQLISELTMGHKQLVEVMKAISTKVKVIAFDEPTSSLSDEEAAQLFTLIKQLAQEGIAVIYVSHRLNEIFSVCDRVTVFKDGKYVATNNVAEITTNDIISMMVGREMKLFEKNPDKQIGGVILDVEGLAWKGKVNNISLHLNKGEILGVFGIVGSGRTEMARLLFGLEKKDKGKILVGGKEMVLNHPKDAVNLKMGFVTEDRRGEGLAIRLSVCQNITMPFFKRLASLGLINLRREKEKVGELIDSLNIKTPGIGTITENLSGGNQQKVVISKWIGSESDILIFDEPTRGIDVGAKAEVYRLMEKLSSEGRSIIMISSELPEVLAMSDRLLVFRDGVIVAEFSNVRELTEEDVLRHAIATSAA
ncbi:MAG: sugar ABC transporter ATP-binding protein [Treponema sp.]|nr:sugar ABC transporter ATP-binding protein [Treponema sp.]